MDPWLFIVFMVVVGAALGGLTNALAIRMLFKPYRALYIGKWKLPLTPGLIPKRHQEIAVQLGNMVGTYLLTAEGLEKQIKEKAFTTGVTTWMEEELRKVVNSEQTLEEFIAENTGFQNIESVLFQRTDTFIQAGLNQFIELNQEKKIDDILPPELTSRIEGYIPEVSAAILRKATTYFESSEGKQKLSVMVDEFLDHKGRLGSMLQMFLGNERLVDKIQPEILHFLQNDRTNQLVTELLEKEWQKLKEQPFSEVSSLINEEKVAAFFSQLVKGKAPILRSLTSPLNSWAQRYETQILSTWIPTASTMMIEIAARRIGKLLETLHIEQIITQQVQSFSIQHLEDLVMSVASKELKLITYLGALIGGVVGLFQGLFVLLINGGF
ncbi:DUF445 domain-containing protein [Alkalicoccobacillus porphyridii]|uniref:DUF445 family protein n=1 Tax=Alkalicoccobacillus porphyridii TaxID=2597270 RepID=A0A553ZWJ6_9BACI|nr:DUF445 family protein [Alkalicoccobacillus porphyridii]TSB45803.1 DUF445 family protein [Alkalicoccobacillus porphyridii]